MKHLKDLGNDIYKVTELDTGHSFLVKWDKYSATFHKIKEDEVISCE